MIRFAALFCASLCIPSLSAAAEFVLQLPLGAKATYSKVETTLAPMVPVGVLADGKVPKSAAPGHIRRTVWAMGGEQTVAEVQAGIMSQLERAGYEPILFCVAQECGGFDFRFGIDVVDEPEMRVDLRDFRFITAKQTVTEKPAFVTFLLSRSPASVYVQMTEYNPVEPSNGVVTKFKNTSAPTQKAEVSSDISVVLEGLEFETGSTNVGGDPEGAIAALAERLKAEPELKVFLVGHSDMDGSAEGNITISKRRAESVRQVLLKDYGISPNRISAYGVGFLAPRADNSTEAGKQKNRRVEAVFSR